MKLFPKLSLTISGLLLAAIAGLSLCFYWTEERNLRHEAGLERQAVLQNLAHIAEESFLTNDDLLVVKYTRWLAQWNPTMVSASVTDPQGGILAHSEPGRIGKQAGGLEAPESARVLVLSEPVHLGAQWVATASVAFSEKSLEEALRPRIRQLQKRVGGIALISLIAGLIASFALALSWTRPIGVLARTAESIGKGRWELHLEMTNKRRDELGFLSRAFEKMAEQLRELDVMKEDFVSAVTHELRSPLGAIESYLNLIAQELNEGISLETWKNYLERLRLNTQRLTRFVNDLLDVAALERGKVKLELRSFNLVSLAQEVMTFFSLKCEEKGLSCGVAGSPELPEVTADPDKIRQVLINLISNAIKFTPRGGHVEVALDPVPEDKSLRLGVKDTGLGIAEADQAHIFSKFEQVRTVRKRVEGPKGTGLGLAISKSLIELHGSTLNVQSRPGKGSIFFFNLPCSASVPADALAAGRAG